MRVYILLIIMSISLTMYVVGELQIKQKVFRVKRQSNVYDLQIEENDSKVGEIPGGQNQQQYQPNSPQQEYVNYYPGPLGPIGNKLRNKVARFGPLLGGRLGFFG